MEADLLLENGNAGVALKWQNTVAKGPTNSIVEGTANWQDRIFHVVGLKPKAALDVVFEGPMIQNGHATIGLATGSLKLSDSAPP